MQIMAKSPPPPPRASSFWLGCVGAWGWMMVLKAALMLAATSSGTGVTKMSGHAPPGSSFRGRHGLSGASHNAFRRERLWWRMSRLFYVIHCRGQALMDRTGSGRHTLRFHST